MLLLRNACSTWRYWLGAMLRWSLCDLGLLHVAAGGSLGVLRQNVVFCHLLQSQLLVLQCSLFVENSEAAGQNLGLDCCALLWCFC
jgi:hypothetical protein